MNIFTSFNHLFQSLTSLGFDKHSADTHLMPNAKRPHVLPYVTYIQHIILAATPATEIYLFLYFCVWSKLSLPERRKLFVLLLNYLPMSMLSSGRIFLISADRFSNIFCEFWQSGHLPSKHWSPPKERHQYIADWFPTENACMQACQYHSSDGDTACMHKT